MVDRLPGGRENIPSLMHKIFYKIRISLILGVSQNSWQLQHCMPKWNKLHLLSSRINMSHNAQIKCDKKESATGSIPPYLSVFSVFNFLCSIGSNLLSLYRVASGGGSKGATCNSSLSLPISLASWRKAIQISILSRGRSNGVLGEVWDLCVKHMTDGLRNPRKSMQLRPTFTVHHEPWAEHCKFVIYIPLTESTISVICALTPSSSSIIPPQILSRCLDRLSMRSDVVSWSKPISRHNSHSREHHRSWHWDTFVCNEGGIFANNL